MGSTTIKSSKQGPQKVPQPERASFVLGSRPAVLRAPSLDRIKPQKPEGARDYGKTPPLDGNTGTSGLT